MLSEEVLNQIRYTFDKLDIIEFDRFPREWCIESILREYRDKIDWEIVLRTFFIDENFLIELIEENIIDDDSIKNLVSPLQKLSEKFMNKYVHKLDWIYISGSQKMSEQFIEKYAEKLDFHTLPLYNQFSNEFIKKYEDKWNWTSIAEHQKNVSTELLRKHKDEIGFWTYLHTMTERKAL